MDEDTSTLKYTIDLSDTIDLSAMNMAYSTIGAQGSNYGYGNITISATGASGTTTAPSYSYSTINNWSNSAPALHVTGDATFEKDIQWKGRSLGKLIESIEDRLAILAEPDPKKLEKFAALKKAYDNYKLLEKLCQEEEKSDE